MPDIYAFNVSALTSNPHWFVLRYIGRGNPQFARNRAAVNRAWGYLRAAAPAGYQLDEFPYARTFRGGVGAWGHMVPVWENSLQGGYFGAFTRYSLRGRPVPFLVVPVPI